MKAEQRRKLREQSDTNFSIMREDVRYKKYLGIVSDLLAHEWPLIRKGSKFYLVYGCGLDSKVFDILLYKGNTIYKDCLTYIEMSKEDLFLD